MAEHACICGKTFPKAHGLKVHRAQCKQAKAQKQEKAAQPAAERLPTPTVIAIVPDAPWRCAECQSDAFARSVADPALCIRCNAQRGVEHANGHAVPA